LSQRRKIGMCKNCYEALECLANEGLPVEADFDAFEEFLEEYEGVMWRQEDVLCFPCSQWRQLMTAPRED